MSADAAIVVTGLTKSYGEVHALRGIDLVVQPGECLAILGPNGAGKTTAVEILEGFRRRDGGQVSVLGLDPESAGRDLRERMGIVLQSAAIDQFLSVREVVELHASYYGAPRDVDEVIDLVGLHDKAASKVRHLSGGQQRRVDLALGLIGDPELIFLDEPTTGFDPTARRGAWEVVTSLRTLGKTVLLTTHYMDEAQHLADRVVVIADGRVVAEGSPDEIGGRQRAGTMIRFVPPPGVALVDLPLPVQPDGEAVLIETDEPTGVLFELTSWAVEHRHELVGLTVARPSLEDIYLELTADAAAAGAPGTTGAVAS